MYQKVSYKLTPNTMKYYQVLYTNGVSVQSEIVTNENKKEVIRKLKRMGYKVVINLQKTI